jgi:alkaline phosphatase
MFIDKAHKALDDFVVFDEAIGEALKMVDEKDTMVVVTADHSHTFSIGGNSMRGNPVYGELKGLLFTYIIKLN